MCPWGRISQNSRICLSKTVCNGAPHYVIAYRRGPKVRTTSHYHRFNKICFSTPEVSDKTELKDKLPEGKLKKENKRLRKKNDAYGDVLSRQTDATTKFTPQSQLIAYSLRRGSGRADDKDWITSSFNYSKG